MSSLKELLAQRAALDEQIAQTKDRERADAVRVAGKATGAPGGGAAGAPGGKERGDGWSPSPSLFPANPASASGEVGKSGSWASMFSAGSPASGARRSARMRD